MTDVDELMDRFEAAWSGHDPHAFAAICAPDLHYEDPETHEPLEGPVELGAHAMRLWRAFPDARIEATGPRLHDGRYIAAPVKLLATHKGDHDDFPASNRFVIMHAILYCELDADRELLWRVRAFFDLYDVAMQLGILPRPGSVGERAMLMLRGFGLRR
jgi:steroid delta-isomerase-like uncharacterized protein